VWFHLARVEGVRETAGRGDRAVEARLKGPRACVLAGPQRAALDELLFYLSVHLPAASTRLGSEKTLDKFSLTGTLRNVTSQAVAWAGGGRPAWGRK
jgi:hypothetical protein